MPKQRKRFLKKKPQKKLSDYPVNVLASALLNALNKRGKQTELPSIGPGYHSIDVVRHSSSQTVVTVQSIINGWTEEGEYLAES